MSTFEPETAQQTAEREGWPVLAIVPFEALKVAGGTAMACKTTDGRDILLRLMTRDEFVANHEAACRESGIAPCVDPTVIDNAVNPLPI